jgi:hypothetical protein
MEILGEQMSKIILFENGVHLSLFHYNIHCTDEQHAMSSHELQKCNGVYGRIFENVLYQVNCTNFVT